MSRRTLPARVRNRHHDVAEQHEPVKRVLVRCTSRDALTTPSVPRCRSLGLRRGAVHTPLTSADTSETRAPVGAGIRAGTAALRTTLRKIPGFRWRAVRNKLPFNGGFERCWRWVRHHVRVGTSRPTSDCQHCEHRDNERAIV